MANRRSSTAGDRAPPVRALARAQGSQFTGAAFTGLLIDNAIAVSMDGRGAWRDNVFVERLWRSVKDEEVYLRACDTVAEARLDQPLLQLL
jgi:transposase InsO family protein